MYMYNIYVYITFITYMYYTYNIHIVIYYTYNRVCIIYISEISISTYRYTSETSSFRESRYKKCFLVQLISVYSSLPKLYILSSYAI